MALEAAAHTAPEAAVTGRIEPVGTRLERREIADHRRLRVLLPEDVIVECPLIVGSDGLARPFGADVPSIYVFRKLQQVERAAVFAVVTRQVTALLLRIEEVLLV